MTSKSALTRREFVAQASLFAAVLAWHASGRLAAQENGSLADATLGRPARFSVVRLKTGKLEPLRRYYSETLGLRVESESDGRFVVQIGATRLEFEAGGQGEAPFYHYAFNIPENKFASAKAWLAKRVPLLKDGTSGQDQIFFEAWNAHAVYFKDPSGNIGELIARHTLKNGRPGEFSPDDLLCVSEIGMPSEEPEKLGAELGATFGLRNYLGSSMFVGDEQGLFVLPKVGRPWIPERTQIATVYPVEATIRASKPGAKFEGAALPYSVNSER